MRVVNLIWQDSAQAAWVLQQAAYSQEAALIGFPDLPPLHESVEDLATVTEVALGAVDEAGQLIGLLSWEPAGDARQISRLAVLPSRARRGVASRLLWAVLEAESGKTVQVTTAQANVPALALYRRFGFTEMRRFASPEGLPLIDLQRLPDTVN